MRIGVPREIKDGEHRVAMTPPGVVTLVAEGCQVLVERGAGENSFISDDEYAEGGADLVDAAAVWTDADLIVKVKEPLPSEYDYLRPNQTLFTYLHLASSRELTEALLASQAVAIAYETVALNDGRLPLLTPMSEVAGKMAVQKSMQYLEAEHGGRGTLIGGVPGVPPAEIVILGCGVVGVNAAKLAVGLGAQVTVIDIDHGRLKYLDDIMHGRIVTVYSNAANIARATRFTDILVGAVLVPGAPAPTLVTEQMVQDMKAGSVIIDVSVDQGGCVETSRPTSHSEPTYIRHAVVHYAVPNMPGAVPRTSTYALVNATLPYIQMLAAQPLRAAVEASPSLARGVNIAHGTITHPAVADTFDLECVDVNEALR